VKVRDKLVLVCVGAIAIQLASAAAETLLARRAARHHASSRAAHEQVEQLIHAQAELARQLKEVGDLSLSIDPAGAAHDRRQIAAAQGEVDRALRRYAELIADEIASPAHERVEAAAASDLARQAAEVHAAVGEVVARGPGHQRERTARGGLDDRFDQAIASLDQVIAGERAEMLEDDLLAAQAAALASTMAWVAPLLCGAILVAGLGLVLRSISRPLAVAESSRELRTSRRAGMAELSSGVLHDLGRVVDGAAVAAQAVKGELDAARIADLVRAARWLDEHRPDLAGFLATPRGAQVPPYLVEATARLADDLSAAADHLVRVEKGIERIRALLSSQQSHVRAAPGAKTLHPDA
jgi:hypothetical protein